MENKIMDEMHQYLEKMLGKMEENIKQSIKEVKEVTEVNLN